MAGENLTTCESAWQNPPPAQSLNVLQQKALRVLPPHQNIFKAGKVRKMALADAESFVPKTAGGICIH